MDEKYWVVYLADTNEARGRYVTLREARDMAERLALQHGDAVSVLEVIGVARPSSVTYTEII